MTGHHICDSAFCEVRLKGQTFIFVIERDFVFGEVLAEAEETADHRIGSLVDFEYQPLKCVDFKSPHL
jgi:hypothetical protein